MQDQCRREMFAGHAFRYVREAPITFGPTYKFDKHTVDPLGYDSSEKRRVPAWTDRIFFRGSAFIKNAIEVELYSMACLFCWAHCPCQHSTRSDRTGHVGGVSRHKALQMSTPEFDHLHATQYITVSIITEKQAKLVGELCDSCFAPSNMTVVVKDLPQDTLSAVTR